MHAKHWFEFLILYFHIIYNFRMLRATLEVNLDQNKLKQKEKQTFKTRQWASGIREEEPAHMHLHIYNFFITQGYYDLAETFAKEARLQTKMVSPREIHERLLIKDLIKQNRIDEVIQKIQQYEFERKDQEKQQQLMFTLKSLKIISLIKENKVEEAISQAKQKLLPYVKLKYEWTGKVEKVMSLMAFVHQNQCKNKYLLSPSYKNKIADEVNSFLIGNQYQQSLKVLLNLGKWCQQKLEDYANFPHINPWSYDLFNI